MNAGRKRAFVCWYVPAPDAWWQPAISGDRLVRNEGAPMKLFKCCVLLLVMLRVAQTQQPPVRVKPAGSPQTPLQLLVAAVNKGDKRALQKLRTLAEQGDMDAQGHLGALYRRGVSVPENIPQAVVWFRKAAEQGSDGAQYNLGEMYKFGEGVSRDVHQAAAWFLKAAEQGYAPAQSELAFLYANGEGVPKSDTLAAAWYRKAAEEGHEYSQIRLGSMYANGEGVPKDAVQAYMWFNLAAAASQEDMIYAKTQRDALEIKMTPAQVAEAQKLSREWRPTNTK